MRSYRGEIQLVVDILKSNAGSLRELARISGRDIFSFYKGCDLSHLDLSGQDLRGLNFENADLRFSNLDDVSYDLGAFNGAILDKSALWMTDNYQFFIDDVETFPTEELLLFCRIRDRIVDDCVQYIGITYREFALAAAVSESALRKARTGRVISMETARNVLTYLRKLSDSLQGDDFIKAILRQPIVEFLGGGNNSEFISISRSRLKRLFEIRTYRLYVHRDAYYPHFDFRDTIEYLSIFESMADEAGY